MDMDNSVLRIFIVAQVNTVSIIVKLLVYLTAKQMQYYNLNTDRV